MDPTLAGEALRARADLALSVPLNAALGLTLIDPDDPAAGLLMAPTELGGNGAGGLHSAAAHAAVEVAGYLALLPHLSEQEHAITHAVTIHLPAAVEPEQGIELTATVDQRTGRTAFISVVGGTNGQVAIRGQLVKTIVRFAQA